MMKQDPSMDFEWFYNVGNSFPAEISDSIPASGWAEACERCRDRGWEDVTMEARNELTVYLHTVCKTEFQNWNTVICEIKRDLEVPWRRLRLFLAEQRIESVVGDCAEWDTMNAMATLRYLNYDPPRFFLRLLLTYQLGRFPCGWNGDWPKGNLVVY